MWLFRIRRPTLALLLHNCPTPNLSTWKGKDPDDRAGPRWRRRRRRRHQGEATEGEEEDATPDLLLKHLDATLVTHVLRLTKHLKHASETLAKTSKNT